MLVPPPLTTELSSPQTVAPWAPYAYLLGGANPQLSAATCLYFDGIPQELDLIELTDLVEKWFAEFTLKPKVVLVSGDKKVISGRHSVKRLRASALDVDFISAIESIEIFPKGRTTIDDTWFPSIYFARRIRKPQSAFFSVNTTLSEQSVKALLLEGARALRSSTTYGFLFPARFSPLGYFWGISVSPSYRALGAWERREELRLPNWRDNTSIGIQQGSETSFYRVQDGYVRDVYPLMLLNERHLSRRVGNETLADIIGSLGDVSTHDGKVLWRVHNENLASTQQLLDANDITLSGRRL